MHIINEGILPKHFEETVRFLCAYCGCEFDADPEEYRETSPSAAIFFGCELRALMCECPVCRRMCFLTSFKRIK